MVIIPVLLIVVGGLNNPAASKERRAAWDWTIEQRIAARFDPAGRAERVRQHFDRTRAHVALRSEAVTNAPEPVDSIHGSDHPELLMPTEIYGAFVRAAFVREDAVSDEFRRDAAEKATTLGLSADFMVTFERQSATYADLERQSRQIRDRLDQGAEEQTPALLRQLADVETAACRERARTLTVLRQRFPELDHYLYAAVAPGVFFTFYEPQDAARLRAQEEGCP